MKRLFQVTYKYKVLNTDDEPIKTAKFITASSVNNAKGKVMDELNYRNLLLQEFVDVTEVNVHE